MPKNRFEHHRRNIVIKPIFYNIKKRRSIVDYAAKSSLNMTTDQLINRFFELDLKPNLSKNDLVIKDKICKELKRRRHDHKL